MNNLKQFYSTIFLLFIGFAAFGQSNSFDEYFRDGMYYFDGIEKITEEDLFTVHKSRFGLSNDYTMQRTNYIVAEDGRFQAKYEAYYKGIPIEGSMYNVQGNKGIVQTVNGFVLKGLNIDVSGLITPENAIDAAKNHIGATKYIWEDATIEENHKLIMGNPDASYYPTPELIIAKKRGEDFAMVPDNFEVCYQINIISIEPFYRTEGIFVDAQLGTIFIAENALQSAFSSTGTVETCYDGNHSNIITQTCTFCTQYKLIDAGRNITSCNSNDDIIKDGDNDWVENGRKSSASAHWAAAGAYDYYLNKHGRWGSDYNGKPIRIKCGVTPQETGQTGIGAFYNRLINNYDQIEITDDNNSVSPPSSTNSGIGWSMVNLEVIGHEYTHAMIKASSNLGVNGFHQSRILNEAYSDIFGELIERHILNTNDWSLGSHTGLFLRHFDDPTLDINPKKVNGNWVAPIPSTKSYWDANWTNTDRYADGGVWRRWFYLLANGGTQNGITVNGIGIAKAEKIAYITFNWYLWSNAFLPDAANQTVQAVINHPAYGYCSVEHKETVKSLLAVGFNNITIPSCLQISVQGNTVIDALSANSIPQNYTISFNDIEASNANDVVWSIPESWTAEVNGNSISVTHFDNFESQTVSATYTNDNGEEYVANKIVHFSHQNWTPTDNISPMNKFQSNDGQAPILERIYPNPASSQINIILSDSNVQSDYQILDLTGKTVVNGEITNLKEIVDISHLSSGVYILQLSNHKSMTKHKLVIRK